MKACSTFAADFADVCRVHEAIYKKFILIHLIKIMAHLEENKPILLRKLFTFFIAYCASMIEIRFIPNQHNYHVRIAILSSFLQPASKMIECVPPSDIIHQ